MSRIYIPEYKRKVSEIILEVDSKNRQVNNCLVWFQSSGVESHLDRAEEFLKDIIERLSELHQLVRDYDGSPSTVDDERSR